MTAMRRAMNAYGQAAETIPPATQIVMLYDGVIRNMKLAQAAISMGRVNERYQAVRKSSTIIEALQDCLDHEQGGEIARQLDQIYTYIIFRLQAINLKNDPTICDEVTERLGDLRESWHQIAAGRARTEETPPAAENASPLAAAITI
jgi:flagellar protein FliS